jgi:hypothetical protein
MSKIIVSKGISFVSFGILGSGILGFYRGTQHYSYNYRKNMEKYDENLKEYNVRLEEYNKNTEENSKRLYKYKPPTLYYTKPYYMYTHSILFGMVGSSLYLNPFTFPIVVMKEVYRLEINMRGELEKKDEYYKLLF